MSRTEERLRDALHAKAGTVRDDRLRPLAGPHSGRGWERRGWERRGWLAPLAAAVAVTLVAVLAIALTGSQGSGTSSGPVDPSRQVGAHEPPFFTEFDAGQLQVRSTATGKLTGYAPLSSALRKQQFWGITAAPDGRTFYAVWAPWQRTAALVRPSVYSFQVTASGMVTPLRLVARGPASGASPAGALDMAVSPDGSELALAAHTTHAYWSDTDTIIVFDLRTGVYHLWDGGLRRWIGTEGLNIWDLSWSGPGMLDFVTSWCANYEWLYCGAGTAQVRTLDVGSGGGSLRASTVLVDLGRFPDMVGAVADQQGHLAIMQATGKNSRGDMAPLVTIDQVDAASGTVLRVLYQHKFPLNPNLFGPMLGDPSGQYLMIWAPTGVSGWLRDGTLHRLPANPPYPRAYGFAW